MFLAGCKTLDWAKEKSGLFDKGKTSEEWRTGNHVISVDRLADWRFSLRVKDQDMTRPNGKPERISVAMNVTGGDWKWYAMIDNRDGIRHRLKGGTNYNYHVSSFVYAPIPKQESKWEWECGDGVLAFSIDGNLCRKYPLKVGDAKLKAIIISPDAGRPAGFKWIAGELEQL